MSKFYIDYYDAFKSKEEVFSDYYKLRSKLFIFYYYYFAWYSVLFL